MIMTILITFGCADRAPCFADEGIPRWSGKRAADLTADDLIDILEFCTSDAGCRGWTDELVKIAETAPATNVFHPEFLRGYPYRWWCQHYDTGRRQYRHEKGVREFHEAIANGEFQGTAP
jgi:hypothetical protein